MDKDTIEKTDPTQQLPEDNRERNFTARVIAGFAGVAAAFATGFFLRTASLQRWIRGRIAGNDSVVKQAWDDVDAALQNKGSLTGYLQKAAEKLENTISSLDKIRVGALDKLKKLEDVGKIEPHKLERERRNAQNNFNYWSYRAKEKVINKEMFKSGEGVGRMNLGLRHSEHKGLIFAASVVTLCVVTYAVYKGIQWLQKKKENKTHQEKLLMNPSSTAQEPTGAGLAG